MLQITTLYLEEMTGGEVWKANYCGSHRERDETETTVGTAFQTELIAVEVVVVVGFGRD